MGILAKRSYNKYFQRLESVLEKTAEHSTLIQVFLLILVGLVAFGLRLFSVIRFESIIHEFDPWFNFRATEYLITNGWYEFLNWFDETAWYPLGRVVGGTVYPGIMVTSAVLYKLLNGVLNLEIEIRDLCVFLAPAFSGLTAIATYYLTKELKDGAAGLLAAALIAVCPGYISRSVAGSYDNEGISIFLMIATFALWLNALKKGSIFPAVLAALTYFWLVAAWGGYVYVLNLIPLHAFVLILMGRFSARLYSVYSTFYVIGTLASMTIPFVGFQPTRTSEHMAAMGVFGLVQLLAAANVVKDLVNEASFRKLVKNGLIFISLAAFLSLTVLTMLGYVAPWTGRFYALWDSEYARKYIPIIASVSEHQPTTWASFFFDLHFLMVLFPAGLIWCLWQNRDEHIFIAVYAITASYFAGVMIRLILTLAPVMCIASALALSSLFDLYTPGSTLLTETTTCTSAIGTSSIAKSTAGANSIVKSANATGSTNTTGTTTSKSISEQDGPTRLISWDSKLILLIPVLGLLVQYIWHCTWVTSTAYSSPSVIMQTQDREGKGKIIDDFREAYHWLRMNTEPNAKILAWWDYGYQLAGMADRPTIADNNTWNNTHIATIGKIFASSEINAYPTIRELSVDYLLVLFGGISGFSGDDMNKFLWMIRIAEGVFPDQVHEADFYTPNQEYRVDSLATETMKNSLLYKMSYYGIADIMGPRAFDRARYAPLGEVNPKPITLDEAFSTEHWMVRIFKVRNPDVLGRSHQQVARFRGIV